MAHHFKEEDIDGKILVNFKYQYGNNYLWVGIILICVSTNT